jgi:biopolymer transport protein ExbD
MRFRPRAYRDEPEINFIPLIDVLLVILIFLMVTTTYSRFAELQINLPTREANKAPERIDQIDVGVDAKGNYFVNKARVAGNTREAIAAQLKRAAAGMKRPGHRHQCRTRMRRTSPSYASWKPRRLRLRQDHLHDPDGEVALADRPMRDRAALAAPDARERRAVPPE